MHHASELTMRHVLDVHPASAPSYPVWCGGDVVKALGAVWRPGWRDAVVIGDDYTAAHFAPRVEDALAALGCRTLRLSFPPGESSKVRATKEALEDAMLQAGVERGGCVVAVGGGIALDLAGFVASTYMRGIAHLNVATTLLAQVDAAVGGKTALNTADGKNLIGAFHHPRAVLLDTAALRTLPRMELLGGLAEAVKHATLRDEGLFSRLERWADQTDDLIPADTVIERSVQIKAEVVAEDDRDRGLRHILNFGHTVAHAIEHATRHRVVHGHAVAAGMVIEARLAVMRGHFPPSDLGRLAGLLDRLGLPTEAPCDFDAASPFFPRDKKTEDQVLRCAIPSRIGQVQMHAGGWLRPVQLTELRAAWGDPSCSA